MLNVLQKAKIMTKLNIPPMSTARPTANVLPTPSSELLFQGVAGFSNNNL
jgi:hypothetical protein